MLLLPGQTRSDKGAASSIDRLFPSTFSGTEVSSERGKKNRPRVGTAKIRPRTRRKRNVPLGSKSGGHSRTSLAIQSRRAPLLQLISAFYKARIPFQIIGMGAAVLQGVPVVTQDLDIWIGREMARHDEVLLLCSNLGADIIDDFKAVLRDSTVLNFTYQVDGLRTFAEEMKSSKRLRFFGQTVPVLPLEQIYASKASVNRPKDRVHLFYLKQAMRLQRKLDE